MPQPMSTLVTTAVAVELKAAPGDDPAKRPTFTIIGYTGAVMSISGFYSPVIVDLAGLKADTQQLPALRDHDAGRIVGQTSAISIDGKGVRLTGTVTGDNADATEVVTQAKNGFEWKASIGANIVRREFLDAGKKATVNGREVVGPVVIAREALLQEISFVSIGADNKTSATVAAKKGKQMPPPLSEATDVETEDQADALHAERDRSRAIRGICRGQYREIESKALDQGWTPDQTSAACLTQLRASRPSGAQSFNRGGGSTGMTRQTLEAVLMVRGGREALAVKEYGAPTVENARHMRASSLVDICAASLHLDGTDTAGLGRNDLVRAAFSTLSLPSTLANVMGKTLLPAYLEATESWRPFGKVLPAANFKPQIGIRPSFVGELKPLPRGGEIKHGTLAEATFPWSVAPFAEMLVIDRQDVVNDDLGFFDQITPLFGVAAGRAVNDLVWSTIIGGQAAGFFATGKNNLQTGNLDVAGLQFAISRMRSQRDVRGNDISIKPVVLAVPPELEFAARALVESTLVGRTDAQPSGNPLVNIVQVIPESRLSNTGKFGAAANATDWYLFAGPQDAPIIVGYLEGREAPIVQSFGLDHQANVLALTFRCYHDFGVALADPRAANKTHA